MPGLENKRIGLGAAVALLLVAGAVIGFQLMGGRQSGAGEVPRVAFFTDDNGKHFFKDDVDKLPPFDHNGKQAFRCDVFQGADGKQFGGLIYRFTDSGRKEMQAYIQNRAKDPDGSTRRAIEQRGMQVKRVAPDDGAWDVSDEVTMSRLQASVMDSSGKPAKLVTP